MIKDKILIPNESAQEFDLMQIALAIKASTLDGALGCWLLDNEIIPNSGGCSLSILCDGIDKLAKWYVKQTTKVINSYSFD